MVISSLKVWNLRNLEEVAVRPHPSLNYLWGVNGAGKTSILESIALLSRGRSFRTTQSSELAGVNGPTYRVVAELRGQAGEVHRVGLERAGAHWRARLDGEDVAQLSSLSRALPTVVMVPDSHQLVSGSPENRRKFVDWGLFHVEQGFLEAWRRFSRALKQRNSALKRADNAVLDSLDAVLAEHGDELAAYRRNYARRVADRMPDLLNDLKTRVRKVDILYQEGWNAPSYLELLTVRRDRDIEKGVTDAGPHRADLRLLCDGAPARAVLSRGEQKAFAAALLLAQCELLLEDGIHPVLLLDDLVSEFDEKHFDIVLEKFLSTGLQAWLTGTVKPEIENPHTMFHVEQGHVTELV
ncbi:MAG: DNA replication/repair protein RecF [Xanthomonadales bacterium]|nr:DNA replication/repair protein RecF [Xanthomonadales bacterium]